MREGESQMADRPGIMFYFDIVDDLEDYSIEEIGELFLAMMKYGKTGEIAEFSDRGMRTMWKAMMKYVDRDQERFDDRIMQKKYAGFRSAAKRKGIPEAELPSYDEWKSNPEKYDSLLRTPTPQTTVNDRQRPLTEGERDSTKSTNYQLSTINSQLSAINCQQSTINSQHSSGDHRGSPPVGGEAHYDVGFEQVFEHKEDYIRKGKLPPLSLAR